MDCPCETCLVRATCGRTLIHKREGHDYLVVEYAERCPEIVKYFGKNKDGSIKHSYEKIYELCKIFKASKERYFLWSGNEAGLYDI